MISNETLVKIILAQGREPGHGKSSELTEAYEEGFGCSMVDLSHDDSIIAELEEIAENRSGNSTETHRRIAFNMLTRIFDEAHEESGRIVDSLLDIRDDGQHTKGECRAANDKAGKILNRDYTPVSDPDMAKIIRAETVEARIIQTAFNLLAEPESYFADLSAYFLVRALPVRFSLPHKIPGAVRAVVMDDHNGQLIKNYGLANQSSDNAGALQAYMSQMRP